jgi:hypothetical protein
MANEFVARKGIISSGSISSNSGSRFGASALDVHTFSGSLIVANSGSQTNTFGNDQSDAHIFTGSVNITGSLSVIGFISGSFSGSGAGILDIISSSYAQTSSVSLSIPIISGSLGTGYNSYTGSFTGSAILDTLQIQGSFTRKFTFINISTILDTTHDIVSVTTGSAIITLPTAINIAGRVYTIDNNAITNVEVDTTSSETINGAVTQSIVPDTALRVVSNGADWRII